MIRLFAVVFFKDERPVSVVSTGGFPFSVCFVDDDKSKLEQFAKYVTEILGYQFKIFESV